MFKHEIRSFIKSEIETSNNRIKDMSSNPEMYKGIYGSNDFYEGQINAYNIVLRWMTRNLSDRRWSDYSNPPEIVYMYINAIKDFCESQIERYRRYILKLKFYNFIAKREYRAEIKAYQETIKLLDSIKIK